MTAPSWFAGRQTIAELLAALLPSGIQRSSSTFRLKTALSTSWRKDTTWRYASPGASVRSGGHQDFPVGLVARRVHSYRWLLTASRTYLEQHGTPRSPEDLARHRWVTTGDFDTLPLTGPDGMIEVPVRAVLRFRSLSGLVNAVAAGIGIAPLPDIYLSDPAFRDVLRPVLHGLPHTSLLDAVCGVCEPEVHPTQDSVFHRSRRRIPRKNRANDDDAD